MSLGLQKKETQKISLSSTFDNAPMLKRQKQSKNFQTSKNFPQSNDNDESERDITGEIYVNRLSKQKRTPWTKEEDLKLVKH